MNGIKLYIGPILISHTKSWCHQMETFFELLALCEENPPVTGGFPSQWPVMWSFHGFFDRCLNKWLRKHSRHCWFETSLCSLWHHCNNTNGIDLFHTIPHIKSYQSVSLQPYPMICRWWWSLPTSGYTGSHLPTLFSQHSNILKYI